MTKLLDILLERLTLFFELARMVDIRDSYRQARAMERQLKDIRTNCAPTPHEAAR